MTLHYLWPKGEEGVQREREGEVNALHALYKTQVALRENNEQI